MISIDRAELLQAAGLRWTPRSGDQFALRQPALVGEVFTISEMTIEPHPYPTGTVLGFNGTTEWALDSVTQDDAVWLPREDQLRELVGDRLESVHRTEGGWQVTYAVREGYVQTVTDADLECAYARAVLSL